MSYTHSSTAVLLHGLEHDISVPAQLLRSTLKGPAVPPHSVEHDRAVPAQLARAPWGSAVLGALPGPFPAPTRATEAPARRHGSLSSVLATRPGAPASSTQSCAARLQSLREGAARPPLRWEPYSLLNRRPTECPVWAGWGNAHAECMQRARLTQVDDPGRRLG